jgi:hypothetical protein
VFESGRDGDLLIVYRNLYSVDYLFGILIFDFIVGYFRISEDFMSACFDVNFCCKFYRLRSATIKMLYRLSDIK